MRWHNFVWDLCRPCTTFIQVIQQLFQHQVPILSTRDISLPSLRYCVCPQANTKHLHLIQLPAFMPLSLLCHYRSQSSYRKIKLRAPRRVRVLGLECSAPSFLVRPRCPRPISPTTRHERVSLSGQGPLGKHRANVAVSSRWSKR